MVLSFSSVIVVALSVRFSMLFGSAWGITAPGLLWYLGGFYTVIQFSEPLLYISGCFLHVCNVGSELSTCTDSNTELEILLSSPLSSVGFSATLSGFQGPFFPVSLGRKIGFLQSFGLLCCGRVPCNGTSADQQEKS